MIDKSILVTFAVIQKDGKILIAQRKQDSILEPNKWEFPGGKVEHLEHPEDCIKREIKGELGLTISVDKLLDVNSHIYVVSKKKYHIILMAFLCKYIDGKVKNIECQDSKWITKEQFKDFDFAVADIPFLDLLKKKTLK